MNKLIIALAVAGLSAAPAFSQSTATANGSGTATSNTTSNTEINSNPSSNSQIYLDQSGGGRSKTEVKNSGSYTLRSAPPVQAPSMGSGHPCGLGGSIGVSIIGGGAAGGATKVDEACLLAQMGQGEAALLMIARRDSEACYALRSVGRIPAGSTCTASETRAAQRQAEARPTARPDIATCERDGNGRLVKIIKKRGVSDADARAFCG